MQADNNDQKGETAKRIEGTSEPPALQQAPPSYIYPTLLEEFGGERMKEFRGVIELECLQPTCNECTSMREEVFWVGR